MTKKIVPLIFSFAICSSSIAFAQEPPCPNDGYIADEMVPSADVAKEIYRVVGQKLVPDNFRKFPIVVANDAGDHWSMSQMNNDPPPKPGPDEVVVTAGGGQLNLDINKCTGAISHAALVK